MGFRHCGRRQTGLAEISLLLYLGIAEFWVARDDPDRHARGYVPEEIHLQSRSRPEAVVLR